MRFRSTIMTGLLATSLALGASSALAQDSTPASGGEETLTRTMILTNPEGKVVGNAKLTESDGTVTIAVKNSKDSGLAPGEHGIHIHETGSCVASGEKPYDSAGGHCNPEGATHGGPDTEGSHAGDLGNLTVNEDGTFEFEISTDKVTLAEGAENSLADEDGSALVIHEMADDMATDPSGESGSRVACGVIFKTTVAAPAASPVASPEASPAA
jgi:Cu-Zn family superoxide dismutase